MKRGDFSRRAALRERMDDPACCQHALRLTFERFRTVNRAISRYPALLSKHVLQDMLRDPGRDYCLADLGAGGCDVARWLVRQARRRGLRLRVLALDSDPRSIRFARRANRPFPEIETVQADVFGFPLRGQADYAFSNHLLHHLEDAQAAALLSRLDGSGLRRFIMSDIARSRFAWCAFALGAASASNGSFLLQDGLASIRRSFTAEELRDLARKTPWQNPVKVISLPPSRLAVLGGTQPLVA